MRLLERIAVTVRRNSPVSSDHLIWRTLRPAYRGLLRRVGQSGLERRINGTDAVRVPLDLYMIIEEYEPEVWREVMREVRPDDTVVDVGASMGLYNRDCRTARR